MMSSLFYRSDQKVSHQGHFAVKKSATIWSFCMHFWELKTNNSYNMPVGRIVSVSKVFIVRAGWPGLVSVLCRSCTMPHNGICHHSPLTPHQPAGHRPARIENRFLFMRFHSTIIVFIFLARPAPPSPGHYNKCGARVFSSNFNKP